MRILLNYINISDIDLYNTNEYIVLSISCHINYLEIKTIMTAHFFRYLLIYMRLHRYYWNYFWYYRPSIMDPFTLNKYP